MGENKMAFLFAGQGAQTVGMGRDVYSAYPPIRVLFDRAEKMSGLPLKQTLFEGPQEELNKTVYAQLALMVVSYVYWKVFQDQCLVQGVPLSTAGSQTTVTCRYAAGLSLGEYTALLAAEALSFEEAVTLVYHRGRLMQSACEATHSTMASLLGLERSEVEKICMEARSAGTVVVANVNAPDQIVISGEVSAVEKAATLARNAGAKRVMPLKVAGAFHSPLMEPAQKQFDSYLDQVSFQNPRFSVLSNVTARPQKTPGEIRKNLQQQILSPVLWHDSMRYLLDQGVTTFYEFGPGRVLTGLLKRLSPSSVLYSIDSLSSIVSIPL